MMVFLLVFLKNEKILIAINGNMAATYTINTKPPIPFNTEAPYTIAIVITNKAATATPLFNTFKFINVILFLLSYFQKNSLGNLLKAIHLPSFRLVNRLLKLHFVVWRRIYGLQIRTIRVPVNILLKTMVTFN